VSVQNGYCRSSQAMFAGMNAANQIRRFSGERVDERCCLMAEMLQVAASIRLH